MAIKITAPLEGYTATTQIGPTVLHFEDGVAQVDNISEGVRGFLDRAGYKVTGSNKDGDVNPGEVTETDQARLEAQGDPTKDGDVNPGEVTETDQARLEAQGDPTKDAAVEEAQEIVEEAEADAKAEAKPAAKTATKTAAKK